MPAPIPCQKKTQLRPSQRCTSLASLPRSKLSWEICAGWVHDQLWQKPLWKEIKECSCGDSRPGCPVGRSSTCVLRHCGMLSPTNHPARVDYTGAVSENEGGSFPRSES